MNVSESVARIIGIAKEAAGGKDITPMHLLYAAAADGNSLASAYLRSEGITPRKIIASKPSFFADKTVAQILVMAEAQSMKFDQPGTVSEALLFVLVTKCNQTKSALEKISQGAVRRLVEKILNGAGIDVIGGDDMGGSSQNINVIKWSTTDPKTAYKNPDYGYGYSAPQYAAESEPDETERQTEYAQSGAEGAGTLPEELLFYGQDLTDKARRGKIDNIIGRDDETNRMIEILCRKTKNNPVLIGEAGVGKSAIVEGFAKRIVAGDVPELLQDKIVFSLDIGLLMGGAKYRGDLEGRLNKVLGELMKRDDIILFIDEIHNIVAGSNSKDGEMGISEILKPRLARGELRCVGATTIDEYRKYIEKDAALERRFAPIMVYAPTPEQSIQILQGLTAGFEKFHKVDIKPAAIVAAVSLSDRYIFDRNLPDKAIDVLDEACAKAKIKAGSVRPMITANNIAEVVSGITKIPVSKINAKDKENLLSLEDELRKAVIGQDKAISAVAKAIRRTRSGIADKNRPVGSFFFLGRTGVGKTEVCKQLASVLFDTEKAFIKLDMSEFSESHSVSKLIGSPPGYVGYEDASVLCDRVKRNPYCLVLFDEIEKAHSDVYNVMLQILDEGRLTDSHGKTVSFKNAIIVLTSNVGVNNISAKNAIGFGSAEASANEEETVLAGMKKKFSPEFINRIDSVIVFNSLTLEDVKKIAVIHLDILVKKLAGVGVSMGYTDATVEHIAVGGYSKEYGVRPLKRLIQTEIEDKISELIITGDVHRVYIDVADDKIVIK